MSNPGREPLYQGLLGRIVFDADMKTAGHSQDEIEALWEARFPKPEEPDNVVLFRPRTAR